MNDHGGLPENQDSKTFQAAGQPLPKGDLGDYPHPCIDIRGFPTMELPQKMDAL